MKDFWIKWKRLSKKIGSFQASVVFSILYFIVIFPIGLITNFFSDYLHTKKFPSWSEYDNNQNTLDNMKDQ